MELPWEDLRYLEALDRTGKPGAAARELGVSVSTFYRRLAEFEKNAGQLCLKRGTGGATLTDFGRSLAQVGRRTRTGLTEVLSKLRTSEKEIEGEVSLTTLVVLLPLLKAPLAQLTQRHPRLHVTLHLGDDGPSVRLREVDVALGVMKRPPVGCWGRRLGQLPFAVFGTKEAVGRKPRRWLVRSTAESTSPEFAWERAHADDIAARAPFFSMVELCTSGVGIALMPRWLAAQHPSLVEVRELSARTAPLERTLWLLAHPDQRRTPRVVALMNELASAFAGTSQS